MVYRWIDVDLLGWSRSGNESRAISEAVKKARISKEVTLHTLRHTYATHLLKQGVNIFTIKELPGHAHIETTMIYLHLARPCASLAFRLF